MTARRTPIRCWPLLAGVVVLGCDLSTTVEDIRDRVDPPSQYRILWTRTQGCSGIARNFAGVKWFWTSEFPGQPDVLAQWNERREITILFPYRGEDLVVMHEILHDLLDGDKRHESPLWDRCEIPRGNTGS